MSWPLFLLGAYLLGSISFSYWIVHWCQGRDVRTLGSGNAGATNVLRVQGAIAASLVLGLDVAKGALPPLVAGRWGAPGWALGAAAVAPVLGHVFPVLHRFRGGKGVATAAGAMFILAVHPALVSLLAFVLVAVVTRQVAIASMVAVGTFPLWLLTAGHLALTPRPPSWLLAAALALASLILVKHWDNVSRLRAGTEWKLGDPRDE